jgi:hypothetical protein
VPDPGFAGLNNPARAGEDRTLSLSVFTSRPYSVPDLLRGSLWISRGWSSTGLGFGYSLFGNELYREESVTGSISRRSNTFGYGVSLSMNRLVIGGLDQRFFGTAALGIHFRATGKQRIQVGGTLKNLLGFGDPVKSEVRPEGAVSISAFLPSTSTLLLFELRITSRYPSALSAGVEFALWKNVRVRMGTGKNPSLYSVGVGIMAAGFRIDLGVEEHTVLGQTRSVSISFSPQSKKQ